MRQRLALIAIPFLVAAVGIGGFKITPDKENVVSSRLIGSWVPDPELHERLKGGAPGKNAQPIEVRSAPEIAEKIPEHYGEFLNGRTLYMAGYIKWGEQESPFVLTDHHGNPHLLMFRERDGDPFGDGESCNVMLAWAKDPKNDLLFMGADFNNEPFRPYRRADEAAK